MKTIDVRKFKKKPVVIEAILFTGENANEVSKFCGVMCCCPDIKHSTFIDIHTLEGVMRADMGDWIIKGVKGEFYPCKPDIFEMTYEPVTEIPPPRGEDEGSSCCERCRSNDGHCAHYKIGLHRCLYFTPAAPVAPAVDEQQYRILGPNEIIQEGDEYLNQFCGWIKTGDACRHITPNEEGMKYRRKIAPVAPAVDIKEQAKREIEAIDMATPGWEKDGLICGVCNKPVNFKDGFIWDGLTNKAAHYDCRTHPPCPSCEQLKEEKAELYELIKGLTHDLNRQANTIIQLNVALNQPKGEG